MIYRVTAQIAEPREEEGLLRNAKNKRGKGAYMGKKWIRISTGMSPLEKVSPIYHAK